MTDDRWDEGRRAWDRLAGWHRDQPSAGAHGDDGEGALDALGDVGLVRRLLDQAELGAVRASRRHGRSWAEIATRLGVTRQSAWERWRDLDDASPAGQQEAVADASREFTQQAARQSRRRSNVRVPNVIGMSCDHARGALLDAGLVAVGQDADGVPMAADGWPRGAVTDQSPESGAKVPAGSSVRLWIDSSGGSAGVREPRRPKPEPRAGRELRLEPSDEAVG
jgi:hypothetical protein